MLQISVMALLLHFNIFVSTYKILYLILLVLMIHLWKEENLADLLEAAYMMLLTQVFFFVDSLLKCTAFWA